MAGLRQSPIPLYFQLASDLRQQIESGMLMPEAQLPNEKELARHYAVSLVTVRGAMRLLLDDGLIVRKSGIGTFVATARPCKLTWSMGSLDDLVATGLESSMRLLVQERAVAPGWVCERLGLDEGRMAHHVRTLRESGGEAFMLTDQYHSPALARGLRKSDFTTSAASRQLVVQIMADKCGFAIGSVRQTMSAEVASRDIASNLGMREGKPLLVVERDFFATTGEIVQTGKAYYRTDRYRYSITVDQSVGALDRAPQRPSSRSAAHASVE